MVALTLRDTATMTTQQKALTLTAPPSVESTSVRALVVDDEPSNRLVLRNTLEFAGYEVETANSGAECLEKMESVDPHVVLLDVMMPEMDGFQVCERLKRDERFQDIPIIFITALTDTKSKVAAFDAGAADYVTKPFQTREVVARANSQASLFIARRQIRRHVNELEVLVEE